MPAISHAASTQAEPTAGPPPAHTRARPPPPAQWHDACTAPLRWRAHACVRATIRPMLLSVYGDGTTGSSRGQRPRDCGWGGASFWYRVHTAGFTPWSCCAQSRCRSGGVRCGTEQPCRRSLAVSCLRACRRQRAATRMCGCDRRIERRRSSSINFHACAIERYAQCGAASVDNGASAGAWPGACSTGAAMGSTRLLPPSLGCDGPRRERSADAVKHPSGQRCGVAWRGGEAWA